MEARELRMGNLVYELYQGSKEIITYDFITYEEHEINGKTSSKEDGSYVFDQIEPIPLTEEWLVRFGFKKTPVNTEFSLYYLSSFNYRIEFHKGGEVWFDDLRYLQYVHQLQNIYFALTGEELKLNDK